MLSDTYLDLIELATRSTMTDGIRESVAWRREKLNNHDDYIRFCIKKFDDDPGFQGVMAAYTSALEQVDSLVDNRGEV